MDSSGVFEPFHLILSGFLEPHSQQIESDEGSICSITPFVLEQE